MSLPHADVNINSLAFEELATSLASLAGYFADGDVNAPIRDFEHLYTRALQQPLGYREITELTGNALDGTDRRAGRTAWLLLNIKALHVLEVHSLLFHNVGGKLQCPMLQQLEKALETECRLPVDRLRNRAADQLLFDVIGVKDGAVWFVQSLYEKRRFNTAVADLVPQASLVQSRVFADTVLEGKPADAIYRAQALMHRAFPNIKVFFLALVLHPEQPDFELHEIDIRDDRPARILLDGERVISSSLHHAEVIREDHEALWRLPQRLQDDQFQGVPPCKGGRTLGILASTARRQVQSPELLRWREKELRDLMEHDYSYRVTRDKVRHDLVDRMCTQGFMRKWGSEYFLTPKGVARYHYCLAKYTTLGSNEPMHVLDACREQRDRIFNEFGWVI